MSGKLDPNEPCGTPDAVYGTKLFSRSIHLTVDLPPRILNLDGDDKDELIARMHTALLAPIEWLFALRWQECFAGKPDGQGGVWPDEYTDIFQREATP